MKNGIEDLYLTHVNIHYYVTLTQTQVLSKAHFPYLSKFTQEISAVESWNTTTKEDSNNPGPPHYPKSGFDPQTGIYHSINKFGDQHKIPTRPDLDIATYVLSHFPHPHQAESKIALIDSTTNQQVAYAWLQRSIHSLAKGLYHTLGVRKGDVVFVLSPNSLLYPKICLAMFSIGAKLTTEPT